MSLFCQLYSDKCEVASASASCRATRSGVLFRVAEGVSRPALVRGTLIEGSELARSVPEGLPRAIYLAFLVSEVHPFADGNGRISRLVMNAELSRTGEARIIIPTLFHEEYVISARLR
ncbi:MAG: hypothetical protein EPO20_06035 [Betaproteobacteria bacterium]|nr:MAG: hypothetical protein EPO20_06035 [Betaproteobacteria bacterium]